MKFIIASLAGIVIVCHVAAVYMWSIDHPAWLWWAFYSQATMQEWLFYHQTLFGSLAGVALAACCIVLFLRRG